MLVANIFVVVVLDVDHFLQSLYEVGNIVIVLDFFITPNKGYQ